MLTQWRSCLVVTVCLLISACSPPGIKINDTNSQINFPHYSFSVTPNERWYVLRPDESKEFAIISKDAGLGMVEIKTARNEILETRLKEASAQIVADDFRDLEYRTMIEYGVKPGHYQISNLRKAEETIGGKKFYTMHYSVFVDSRRKDASLYLTFPKEQANQFFVLAHYSESTAANVWLVGTHRKQFMQMLASLTMKN